MKKYIAAGIILMLAFGLLMTLAWDEASMLLGAVAGVLAGLASIYFSKARIASKSGLSAHQDCSQDCDPRFGRWYYLSGMVLATYFGALMALQAGLPTWGARLVVGTTAGLLEGIAFISLGKGVRASHQADAQGRSGYSADGALGR